MGEMCSLLVTRRMFSSFPFASHRHGQAALQDMERKYEETCRKITLIEHDLERAEERAEVAEDKKKALETELTHLTGNLRSLTVAEEKANQADARASERVKILEDKLKSVRQPPKVERTVNVLRCCVLQRPASALFARAAR
jgi:septal ring factor EnvC (AmiA/AmiB activator)